MHGIYAKTLKMIGNGLQVAALKNPLSAQEGVQPSSAAFSVVHLRFALLLQPLFLTMAFYSVQPQAGFNTLLFAGLSLIGISLLLLAAQAFHIHTGLTAMAALLVYSAVLTFAASSAHADSALVLAMVFMLPLEIWLVTHRRIAVTAGAGLAALLLTVAFIKGTNTQPTLPAGISAALLFIYMASILLRVLPLSRAVSARQAAFSGALADTDMEAALDALIIRLDKDGHIRSLSDHCAALFGVDRAVLVNSLLFDRVHVADRVHYLAFLNGLQNTNSVMKTAGKTEIRLRCVENNASQPDEQAKIYFNSFEIEGQVTAGQGFLIVARNMEQVKAEQQRISRQNATIENLEFSRNRLLGTVSHELRTPLNSIIGFSDLLLHDVAGPLQSEKQREYIDLIRKSGSHLLEVVNTILEASRLEAGRYPLVQERFAMRDSVTMCNAMLMPLAEKKGVILCDRIHPLIQDVVADRRAVQQILINLVSNAIKYTNKGGCVTIDIMPEAAQLVISVSDTGIGLTAEEINRLCQPFTRIDDAQTCMQEGTGLGLYLVKGLVSLHQGHMDIRSRKGEGTIVTIKLPQPAGSCNADNSSSERVQTANPVSSGTITQMGHAQADMHRALEQVRTTIINLQAQQAESSYDGKTGSQRHKTQGEFHAQERKTA